MDAQFGWRGLCIEPFPSGMEKRSCKVLKEVVSNVSGTEVQFQHRDRPDGSDVLGGMRDTLGRWTTTRGARAPSGASSRPCVYYNTRMYMHQRGWRVHSSRRPGTGELSSLLRL